MLTLKYNQFCKNIKKVNDELKELKNLIDESKTLQTNHNKLLTNYNFLKQNIDNEKKLNDINVNITELINLVKSLSSYLLHEINIHIDKLKSEIINAVGAAFTLEQL
ncbi:8429_t:CDS:1, partial [Cetraspora pellucida]